MDLNLYYPKIYGACEHVCGVGGLAVFAGSAKGNFCMYYGDKFHNCFEGEKEQPQYVID